MERHPKVVVRQTAGDAFTFRLEMVERTSRKRPISQRLQSFFNYLIWG